MIPVATETNGLNQVGRIICNPKIFKQATANMEPKIGAAGIFKRSNIFHPKIPVSKNSRICIVHSSKFEIGKNIPMNFVKKLIVLLCTMAKIHFLKFIYGNEP